MFLLLTIHPEIYSQFYDPSYLENLLENISSETGCSPLVSEIEGLIENPLPLRTATIDDILKIPGFTTTEAREIVDIITRNNDINYEMIDTTLNLSEEQMYLLQLCTTTDFPNRIIRKSKNLYIRVRDQEQIQEQYGFIKNKFTGSPLNLNQRTTLYYDNYSAGIMTDKDPGEISVADFFSYYLSGELFKTRFIIGDYYLENGMGNLFWKSFGTRKGGNVVSPVIQYGTGIKPNRSTIDYNFFRGIALQKKWRITLSSYFTASAWASSAPRSATLDSSSNYVTSIYTSGYYRTPTEQSKRNAVNEQNFGGNLEWNNSNSRIGFTSYYLNYSKEIQSISKNVFNGKSGILSSLYFIMNLNKTSLASELSRDAKGNWGYKAAAQLIFPKYEFAFLFRSFDSEFRSPFGYNFGESASPSNELGVYCSFLWKISGKFVYAVYLDVYKNFSVPFAMPEASNGFDLFSEIYLILNSNSSLKIRIQNENDKDAYRISSNQEYSIFRKNRTGLRIDLKHTVNSNLKFHLRTEAVFVSFMNIKPDESGLLSFADMSYKLFDFCYFGGRISYFSTNSYESAIWQFEPMFPEYMNTSAMYGKGGKLYIYTSLRPIEQFTLWVRYSVLTKDNVESIGSGYNEISGNNDSRLFFQIDVSL